MAVNISRHIVSMFVFWSITSVVVLAADFAFAGPVARVFGDPIQAVAEWRDLSAEQKAWCAGHTGDILLAGDALGLLPRLTVDGPTWSELTQETEGVDSATATVGGRHVDSVAKQAESWRLARQFVELEQAHLAPGGFGSTVDGEFWETNLLIIRAHNDAIRGFWDWADTLVPQSGGGFTWEEVWLASEIQDACRAAFRASGAAG